MKILFCHHLEEVWNDAMQLFGTSIYSMCERVAEYLSEHEFDRVIITQFELAKNSEFAECYMPIYSAIEEKDISIKFYEYGYGWELSNFLFDEESLDSITNRLENGEIVTDGCGNKIAQGGNHSEVVLIENWLEALHGHEVTLCGAFEGECLEDISLAMDACNISYRMERSLIV